MGGFGTARHKRRRRLWLLLLVVGLLCLPVLIYIAVTSVTSTVAENPDSGSKNVSASNPNSGETSQKGESPRAQSAPTRKDDENKAKKVVRMAPVPPSGKSCDDLRVLVDHTHSLPKGYAPRDLVPLESYGISTLDAGLLLRRPAARHLKRLMAAATADGEDLTVASAYRSYADQQQTFSQFTNVYGDETDTVSAPPGQSQHQLGTAVDFTNAAADYRLWWPFGDTTGSAWLLKNAPDYGFVLAYPNGKQKETGYQWEPWHYRYIGVKNATYLEEENLTLQQFLVRERILPRC